MARNIDPAIHVVTVAEKFETLRVNKKMASELVDRFEAALDYVAALDPVPFYIKREAAEKAAKAALEFIRKESA